MITFEEIKTLVKNREDEIHVLRQAIESFRIAVQADVLKGELVLGDLFSRFIQMNPCLHRYCNDEDIIDLNALVYALQRLPEEVTKKSFIYIKKEPEIFNGTPGIIKLKSKERRRAVYDLGKELLFIAREGESDIFDIVTCLIMFGIEARKIKKKLSGREDLIADIELLGFYEDNEESNQIIARLANFFGVKFADLIKANKHLDNRLFFIIKNIAFFEPEKIFIKFDSAFSKTDASIKAKRWAEKIVNELKKYGDRPIAIVSSDTHAVVNCLTGFAIENREKIMEMAKKEPELMELDTSNTSCLHYFLQRLSKKPENEWLLKEKIDYEESLGIRLIRDEFDTGVDVQIIDTSIIAEKYPNKVDSRVIFNHEKIKEKGLIILNMDYSFGKQGIHNMRALCQLLGKSIESISIMGKAGITLINEGKRFDIMLPTYVVPQIQGGIYDFPTGNNLTKNDFIGLFDYNRIHTDRPMLTVPGTAMENDLILYYYIYYDNIMGVEMEAAPYIDAIEKAYKRNQMRTDLALNVGYWASDAPLNSEESLAEKHMDSGFVSAYALILAILNKILNK